MKKLRITVDGKVFDVSVELLDQVSSTTSAPAPAPLQPGSRTRSLRPCRGARSGSHARPRPGRRAGDVPSPLAGKVVSWTLPPAPP
ncbi:hypothetical protein M8N44_00055 [Akkermansia sp. Marseille-P6666]|uniref:Acetyl-CoA carboxylase biotin carboxyl carrier protein subunit n=1 Tax=Akkermansia massiliensis TaxID=2927224 RepID=A0ABT0R6H3_9BACT|nr:hypothetical protein [Akkermansia massiliensis]MCL6655713.1 hypothetical protein [Akkermansia massiliensis]